MFFYTVWAEAVFSTFGSGSTFLQSVSTRKKEAAKSTLPLHVPKFSNALLLIQKYCIPEQLHARAFSPHEAALKNEGSSWIGGTACAEGLQCLSEVSLFENF